MTPPAPPPPLEMKIEGALSDDTTASWNEAPGAVGCWVRWRATDQPTWQYQRYGTDHQILLKDTVIDDWTFGVAAVSAKGFVSPTSFAGAR